jgi:hypothetical protein
MPKTRVVKAKDLRNGCKSMLPGHDDRPKPRLNSLLNDAERTIPFTPMMANIKPQPTPSAEYVDRMIMNMWQLYEKKG